MEIASVPDDVYFWPYAPHDLGSRKSNDNIVKVRCPVVLVTLISAIKRPRCPATIAHILELVLSRSGNRIVDGRRARSRRCDASPEQSVPPVFVSPIIRRGSDIAVGYAGDNRSRVFGRAAK